MRFPFPVLLALLTAPLIQAQALVAGFDSPEYITDNVTADVAGQNGWTINDATPDISFFVLWGYLGSADGNQGAAVGGYLDAPVEPRVELANTYGGALAESLTTFKFSVQPSTTEYPGTDVFGWTLRDSSASSLLTISLEPNTAFSDRLQVVWYDASNTRTATGYDLFYGSAYDLSLSFTPSGSDASFSALIGGADPLPFVGTLPGAAGATLQTVGATVSLNPGALAYGDNFLVFDNLSVQPIPEPSVAALAVAGLLISVRRRR